MLSDNKLNIITRYTHIEVDLEGETFLRNKHENAFFEIKCTFFGRKKNTISYLTGPINLQSHDA